MQQAEELFKLLFFLFLLLLLLLFYSYLFRKITTPPVPKIYRVGPLHFTTLTSFKVGEFRESMLLLYLSYSNEKLSNLYTSVKPFQRTTLFAFL